MRTNKIITHSMDVVEMERPSEGSGASRTAPQRPDSAVKRALSSAKRIPDLDFAKGILVLIMVIYHWMNYFIGLDSPFYKYLRFLTPSFIFVAGFLVSHAYLSRFDEGQKRIPIRLIKRGLKLLGIVLFLNVAAKILGTGIVSDRVRGQSIDGLAWAYVMGFAPVAFSVLVPTAYLLILSAGLLITSRHFRGIFHLVSAAAVVAVLVSEWTHFSNGYLEMLSVGMLGISLGHFCIDGIHRVIQRGIMILIAYGVYIWAVTVWNAVYLLQVIGVCLNLALFYGLGCATKDHVLKRILIRLGEYSLFAYVAQIVILQIVRHGALTLGRGLEVAYVALFLSGVCTILSVELLDRLKRRVDAVNYVYAAIFR